MSAVDSCMQATTKLESESLLTVDDQRNEAAISQHICSEGYIYDNDPTNVLRPI